MSVETQQNQTAATISVWGLSGLLPGETTVSRTLISTSPCAIGRSGDCDLILRSKKVSKRHAEIITTDVFAVVTDVGSTNGTFVNGTRIHSPTPVGTRDLIQFADVELCVIRDHSVSPKDNRLMAGTDTDWSLGKTHLVPNKRTVTVGFQPLVHAHNESTFGYEVRIAEDAKLVETASSLFDTVTGFGQDAVRSRLCRAEAIDQMRTNNRFGTLFLSTEVNEPLNHDMIKSLTQLRSSAGERPLVLQIHEYAVPDLSQFSAFAAALRVLNIKLAFVDFGVGQSRLSDLTQLRPDFLKFSPDLIRGLGNRDDVHYNMVRKLHNMAADLNICTIADGLEHSDCIEACRDIGFQLLQGPAFGRHQLIEHLP